MAKIAARTAELRQLLTGRRREMQDDVARRIRDGRADRLIGVRDDLEHTDADTQGDLDLALLQMKAETLLRIDQALIRLDAGTYGSCFECGDDIAERRLRALPFAVRCQSCEERREQAQGRAQKVAQRRGTVSLFSEAVRL